LGARPRITYEPLGYEALRAANRATFGRDAIPHYAIEDAGYLLSFGADFLETWLNPVAYAGAFVRMHALGHGRAGTFVAVEPRQSMTAANADEWLRSAPGTEGVVALAMLRSSWTRAASEGGRRGTLRAAVKGRPRTGGRDFGRIRRVDQACRHDFAGQRPRLPWVAAWQRQAGGDQHPHCREPAQHRRRRGRRTVPLRAVRARQGEPYSGWSSSRGHGGRRDRSPDLGDVNPVYGMPPKSGFAEALAKSRWW
jgi:hypothetical protein